MLAVVKSIERFHIYMYGLDFTVVTDCHALVYAMNKANFNPRIARWTLKLQSYRFEMILRAGERTHGTHVDTLNRIVNLLIEPMSLEHELELKHLQGVKLKTIAEILEFEDNDK